MTDATKELDPIALYAIEEIAEGRTLVEIGAALGMSSGAVYARCSQNAELQRRYMLARETAADLLETELIEVLRKQAYENPKGARVHAAGLQWILSKRCQRRYGERLALDHSSPDGSMSPKEALDPSKLSQSALDELMAARRPETSG